MRSSNKIISLEVAQSFCAKLSDHLHQRTLRNRQYRRFYETKVLFFWATLHFLTFTTSSTHNHVDGRSNNFNERRLREKSFKTLVIRGRLCFDRSIKWRPSSSTQRKREAYHAPVCSLMHVPRRSLPRNSFCSSLGLFFHLNVSNLTTKQKSRLIFIFDAIDTHTKPMLVKQESSFNLRSIHFCRKNCLVRMGTIFVNKMFEVIFS